MRLSSRWMRGRIAASTLVLLLAMPLAEAAEATPQLQLPTEEPQRASSVQATTQDTHQPKDPGASADQTDQSAPDSAASPRPVATNQGAGSDAAPSASELPQAAPPKPVGTAAAPYEKTTGVTASSPAGAVIAPGKQRRTRSILIKVGVIVGAAVAVGTVVALSRGSSSRPN